jgi:uncharacterized protein YqhQ
VSEPELLEVIFEARGTEASQEGGQATSWIFHYAGAEHNKTSGRQNSKRKECTPLNQEWTTLDPRTGSKVGVSMIWGILI